MKSKLTVSIVIPNFNGLELLKKHLPSVIKSSYNREIIIVDDCSNDGSREFIENNYPDIKVITTSRRSGFSSAVNLGVSQTRSDIVILLNTDIVPQADFIAPLVMHFETNPQLFAVGCLDRSHEKGKIVLRGRGLARWERGFYIHERGETDRNDTAWVSGGSGAFRKSMWTQLGGMDERFNPFYWEDIDLSYRALEKGWKIIFEPESIVDHYHEQGIIKTKYEQKAIKTIAYRNQFIFIFKHGRILKNPDMIFWIKVRLIQALIRLDMEMIRGFFSAAVRYLLK